jgi:hypothetical protein
MKPNMGTIDRSIRVLFAAAVAVLYFAGALSGTAAAVLGALAVVMVVTSFVGFCPLYVPLHLSTRKKESGSESS